MGMKKLEEYHVDFIDVIKGIMATNLTNKGVSASRTESLQSLANKIANVSTGKKVATGQVGLYSTPYPVEARGLTFKPSRVFWYSQRSNGHWVWFDSAKSITDYFMGFGSSPLAKPIIFYPDGFRCETNDGALYGQYATWVAIE